MVYVSKDTPYMQRLKPFLEKKKALAADEWGCDDLPVREVFDPLEKWFLAATPSLSKRYPQTWKPATHIGRLVRNILLSVGVDVCYFGTLLSITNEQEELVDEWASYFEGLSEQELEALAESFSFRQLVLYFSRIAC